MVNDNKRYYWLKLKEDFFQDDIIEWLEEQANGKDYVLFYLKLCLKSLKNNGVLIRQVGNMLVPYDVEKLAEITKTSVDTVAVALKVFEQIGLVEVQEGGQLYLTHLNNMVGSESASPAAVKKRAYRDKLKHIQGDNKEDNAGTNCPTEKEYRVKSIELKKEKENKPTRHKYGHYENVLLSDDDLEKLKSEFPKDWQNRIERLSEYIASSGKKYKSHLATIRSWARTEKPTKKGDYEPPKDDLLEILGG